MLTILIISIIIVLVVLFLAVGTTSKAYQYKHTVDELDKNPNINNEQNQPNTKNEE
ncbi:YtzI protein [Fredinandcohnia sp. 179-A 10B2 NHS]|uniref:YtzI protein n=1 Tax=Fredinandcohnia sp. 179-A 10B2 NHS TaxID=3235176 RepID=UPI0039A01E3A